MRVCEQLVSVEASAQSVSNELRARESEWESSGERSSSASIIDGDAAAVVDDDAGVEGGRAVISCVGAGIVAD